MSTATELPAGRELDALVADRVMGWASSPVSYSANLPCAWQLLEKWADDSWSVAVEKWEGPNGPWEVRVGKFAARHVSLPVAICWASLQAAEWLAPLSAPETQDRLSVRVEDSNG